MPQKERAPHGTQVKIAREARADGRADINASRRRRVRAPSFSVRAFIRVHPREREDGAPAHGVDRGRFPARESEHPRGKPEVAEVSLSARPIPRLVIAMYALREGSPVHKRVHSYRSKCSGPPGLAEPHGPSHTLCSSAPA